MNPFDQPPKPTRRLFLVMCGDHGTAIGAVSESPLGAIYTANVVVPARDVWGDRLRAEREAFGGGVPDATADVVFLIDELNLPPDALPPRWITGRPAGWCRTCGRKDVGPQRLRDALAQFRLGQRRELLV